MTESFPEISVDLPTPVINTDTNSLPFFEFPDEIDLETVSYAPSKWLRLNSQELDSMKPADRIHVRNIMERFFKTIAPRNATSITSRFAVEQWPTQRIRLFIPGELTRSLSGDNDPEHFGDWVFNFPTQAKVLRNHPSPKKLRDEQRKYRPDKPNPTTPNTTEKEETKPPTGMYGDHGMNQTHLSRENNQSKTMQHRSTTDNPPKKTTNTTEEKTECSPSTNTNDNARHRLPVQLQNNSTNSQTSNTHFGPPPPPSMGTRLAWRSKPKNPTRRTNEDRLYNVQVKFSLKQPDRGPRYQPEEFALDGARRMFSSTAYVALNEAHRQRNLATIPPQASNIPILSRSKDVNFKRPSPTPESRFSNQLNMQH